jgi:Lrp/AsnC family leucine-responsive transcriptional regulator
MKVQWQVSEYDYFIKVAVDGTQGYADFLSRKLYKIPGVRHSRSSFTLGCLKKSLSVPPAADTPLR